MRPITWRSIKIMMVPSNGTIAGLMCISTRRPARLKSARAVLLKSIFRVRLWSPIRISTRRADRFSGKTATEACTEVQRPKSAIPAATLTASSAVPSACVTTPPPSPASPWRAVPPMAVPMTPLYGMRQNYTASWRSPSAMPIPKARMTA